MTECTTYYERVLSTEFANLLAEGGDLQWLVDYAKAREDLDIVLVKNKSHEHISVYRGLSRIAQIINKPKRGIVEVNGADSYKEMLPSFYGRKSPKEIKQAELEKIRYQTSQTSKLDCYYKNKKEGYYQNAISRAYGLCGKSNSEFVILDREAMIGYEDQKAKDKVMVPQKEHFESIKEQIRQKKGYSESATLGDKLDFLALDKNGNILLIEVKYGDNTSGIYWSPLQIGLYLELYKQMAEKIGIKNTIFNVVKQKQSLGLINPEWKVPSISEELHLIPVLVVAEPKDTGSSRQRLDTVLKLAQEYKGNDFLKDFRVYGYTIKNGLEEW